MHGQKKPRQTRPLKNPIYAAILSATLLTAAEIEETMRPIRQCQAAIENGKASPLQLSVMETSLSIAKAVERSRIIRGLGEILQAGDAALLSLRHRSCESGQWQPATPTADELDAIKTAINMHHFQLRHVSAGEFHRIIERLKAQAGGALRLTEEEWGIEQMRAACNA